MDDAQITRLEQSFSLIAPQGQQLVAAFYERLFTKHPGVRSLFPPDMVAQEGKLLGALSLVAGSLRALDQVVPLLHDLGQRHAGYGTQPEHYGAVRDCLVESMAELAADAWSGQLTQDWNAALNLVAQTMLDGANTQTP